MLADGADDPAVDRQHHVVAFGGRNEGAGQYQVALAVADADQHFVMLFRAVAQVHDGHGVQAEVVVCERFVQA